MKPSTMIKKSFLEKDFNTVLAILKNMNEKRRLNVIRNLYEYENFYDVDFLRSVSTLGTPGVLGDANLEIAIIRGIDLDKIKIIVNSGVEVTDKIFITACRYSSLETIKFLHEIMGKREVPFYYKNELDYYESPLLSALQRQGEQFDLVKYLVENKISNSDQIRNCMGNFHAFDIENDEKRNILPKSWDHMNAIFYLESQVPMSEWANFNRGDKYKGNIGYKFYFCHSALHSGDLEQFKYLINLWYPVGSSIPDFSEQLFYRQGFFNTFLWVRFLQERGVKIPFNADCKQLLFQYKIWKKWRRHSVRKWATRLLPVFYSPDCVGGKRAKSSLKKEFSLTPNILPDSLKISLPVC